MPKWVYPLAFLFVLFLIATQPDGAGDTAGEFAGFLVDLLGALGQFLTGLFEGASEANTSQSGGDSSVLSSFTSEPSTVDGTVVDGTVGETITHDHGGTVTPHSHTVLGDN